MKKYSYQLTGFAAATPTITIAHLAPKNNQVLHYQAGQYLEILYPDGGFQPFSIANAPENTGKIELHIRHRSEDFPTENLVAQLQIGRELIIRGPFGRAYYRHEIPDPILLLAGGTGFAATKAILEEAIKQNDQRSFHLYWSVKVIEDFYFPDLPRQWQKKIKNFQYTPIVTQPEISLDWQGKVMRIPEILMNEYSDFSQFQVYASGPHGMVQAAYALLQQHGLRSGRIFSDMLTF